MDSDSKPVQKVACKHCLYEYSSKDALNKHLRLKRCEVLNAEELKKKLMEEGRQKALLEVVRERADQQKKMDEMMSRMEQVVNAVSSIKDNQTVVNAQNNSYNQNNYNQNLQVMCLTPQDDILEILTNRSNLKEALTCIKNCALASLSGDCRIIQKVYLKLNKPALMYGNKSKTQFVYYDRDKIRRVETNPKVMAKILAENIQRCYLKGSSSLKDETGNFMYVKTDHPYLPKVEEYDMEIWNSHIYELNDEKYQRKILTSLDIPFESEVTG